MILKTGKKYLFDTTVFIHVLRGKSAARQLIWQAKFHGISVGYSVITEAELWVVIQTSPLRTEKQHRTVLRPFKRYFINVNIAKRAGELRGKLMQAGIIQKTQGPHLDDCLIAATSEYYGLIVVTDNTRDFAQFKKMPTCKVQYQSY